MSELNTENASQNEIQTKRKAPRTPKAIWLYLLAFVVVFVICSLFAVSQMTVSRTITITINSASVARGQNPDGSAFDIYQILSDEVLEAAAEKLGGSVSAAELKQHLSVSDALTVKTNQQLKQSILDGEYENTYFPAAYSVTYSAAPEGGRLVLGTSVSETDKILAAVAESYQEFYESSYLTYDALFQVDWERIDAMDYYNRSEALRTEAIRLLRFLQDQIDTTSDTGIASGKLTYRDLGNDLWKLISVDIENHQAYIIQNNITTSRKALLRQFRYMEELYKEEKERMTEAYLILNEAVDMYDSTTTKVVFIPALDQDNSFYMNRTKVGLDYLVESADSARLAADEAEHNAQYYQYLQTCFADAVTPEKGQIAHADAVYQNIKEQFAEVAEETKLLLEESNQTANEGIKVGTAGMSSGIVGIGMSFAKRFVILSLAAYALLYIPTGFFRKKPTAAQEV